jgi:hypothetical protein
LLENKSYYREGVALRMNQSFAFEILCENFQPKLINFYSNFKRFFNFLLCDLGKLIFRQESVDPVFLTQYQFESFDIDPQFWSMEEGYTQNKIDNYPLRTYNKGKTNGFNLYVKIPESTLENMDKTCRKNPLSVKLLCTIRLKSCHQKIFILFHLTKV